MVAGENAETHEEGSYYHAKEILDKFGKSSPVRLWTSL